MRPLNAFEKKLILDYNPHAQMQALRYRCLRALEIDAASNGAVGSRSDYYNSMLSVSNAIRLELGLPEADESAEAMSAPMMMSMSLGDDNDTSALQEQVAVLTAKVAEQEEELIQLDEEMDELKTQPSWQFAGLPATRQECDSQFTKAQLLDKLYGVGA